MGAKFVSEEEKNELNGHTPASQTWEDFEIESPPTPQGSQRLNLRGGRGITLLVGVGLVVAVGGTILLLHKEATPATQSTQQATPTSMTVTLAPVETTTVVRTLEVTGTVAARELIPVLPQTTGLLIRDVRVTEGSGVQKGTIMAVLDNSVLQTQISQNQAQLESTQAKFQQQQAALGQAKAALGQAEANWRQNRANYEKAKRDFQRYRQLATDGAITKADLDTRETTVTTAAEAVGVASANIASAQAAISSAQANVVSAQADVRNSEARLQQSQTQLGQTLVVAPASGIIVAPNSDGRCDVNATGTNTAVATSIVRVGDTSGTKALFCIIRNGVVELQAKVPEVQLSQVHIGAPVSITSKVDNGIHFQGSVREVNPIVDPQTRQATVKIDLPASALLKPGMFLQASITAQNAEAMTVPAKAFLPQSDGKGTVYLLEGNDAARAQNVEVGVTIGGYEGDVSKARVEIKSGLKLGDRVIVDGAPYLQDGDKVKVVAQPGKEF